MRLPKGGEGGAVGAGVDGSPLPFWPSFMVGSYGEVGELGVRKLGAGEGVTEGPRLPLSLSPPPGAGYERWP